MKLIVVSASFSHFGNILRYFWRNILDVIWAGPHDKKFFKLEDIYGQKIFQYVPNLLFKHLSKP